MPNDKTTNKELKPAESDKLTVSVKNDLSQDEKDRLKAIISSKEALLKKSLGCKDCNIVETKEQLSFPWFTLSGEDGEAEAYTLFVEAIIQMAKTLKRVTATAKEDENEKFAMRIFTVRLGLKGDKYKLLRKLLMKNLSGNSSWKNGKPEPKVTALPSGGSKISEEIAP